ncbi:zinc finger protein 883-like [Hetaerina americana]|uniref:zinc finger protein 883-like n=1 Tax=Hetaerina americana TaxID=62018 RepID=UPI003A7F36BC
MDPSFKYTLCRLCLYKSERLVDIFGMNGVHGYVAAEVIEDLLQYKVSRTDGYPQSVCSSCLDKLTEFKIFKEQCKGSMVAFESGFDPERFHFADGLHADSINFSPASLVKVEMIMPEADDHEEEHHIGFHYLDGGADDHDLIGKVDLQGKMVAGKARPLSWGEDVSITGRDGVVTLADMVDASGLLMTPGDEGKPFGCGICSKRFARSNKLVQHIRTHTGERPFVCEICGRAFNRKDKLSLHRKTHNTDKPYQCPTCGKAFCRSDYLLQHRKSNHPDEEIPHFPCTECGAAFTKEKDLTAHVRTVHYSCADCGRIFPTEADLLTHAASVAHTGAHLECVDCGKVFEDREKLRKHGKVHRRDSAYSCEWCGKVFYRMDKMLQHRRVHTKERPYHCDLCGKGFSRSDKMTEHRRIHNTSVKPYECPECHKRFTRSDYLLQHRKTHVEDARKFKCETCNKGFVSNKDLVVHRGTHSLDRPFKCDECGKTFKRKGALNSHKKGTHMRAQAQLLDGVPWTPLKDEMVLGTFLQAPFA